MRHVTIFYRRMTLTMIMMFRVAAIMIAIDYNPTFVLATDSPVGNTITTKLADTLKSITSNTSNSVQDAVDDVIANTMDILIDNSMSKLENATIYDNSDTSNIKFEPNIPSSIDMALMSN